ncbi:MAG: peptidylprolyl isomerase [candidate division Zixibacteria bacterium]|nr:peptidylprolyl isomerase [candidate division Zixibacteria bacterium]
MYTVRAVLTAFMLLAIMWGCRPPEPAMETAPDNDFPVATIDDKIHVNYSDLYNRLAASDLLKEGGLLDSTTYFDTLYAIVEDSLVSQKALTADLRNSDIRRREFELLYFDFYVKYLFQHLILDSIKIDSLVLDSFYHEHEDRYFYREQVHARQITISPDGFRFGEDSAKYASFTDEQLDSVAQKQIIELKARTDAGEKFNVLAYDFSMNRATGDKGGDMGYFFRNTFNDIVDSVAFTLEPGIVSDPFRSPDGWHLMQVLDHIDSGLAPMEGIVYEQVRHEYISEVSGRRAGSFVDSLMNSTHYEFNDSALSLQPYSVPDTVWSVVLNHRDTVDFYRLPDVFNRFQTRLGKDSLTLEERQEAIKYWTQKKIIVAAGDTLGFDTIPEVRERREQLYHKYAMAMVRDLSIDRTYQPSDSLIEAYYQEHINEYTYEQPVYVQHIIVEDSLLGEYLRDLALSGLDFLELAKEYYPGAPEIRESAADLGFVGPGEMPDEFFRVAMATAAGEVSHPVKTEFGYHVIKVLERRFSKDLLAVKGDIIRILTQKHNQAIYEKWNKELFRGHKVKYNLKPIKTINLPPKSIRVNI